MTENQGSTNVECNHHDKNTAGDQHMDQNGCEFVTLPNEADIKRTSTCEDSVSDKVKLKVVFSPTVLNSNSSKSTFSGNEKSANNHNGKHTAEKLDCANGHSQDSLEMSEITSTSSDNLPGLKCTMQAKSATQNSPERTKIGKVSNGDDTRSEVNSTTSDVLVAAMQVDGGETNTVENKENNELQDQCNVSSSDNNNDPLSKMFTSNKQQRSLTRPSEDDTRATVVVPPNQEATGKNQVVENPTYTNKTPETIKPNNEQRKRSASTSAGNPQERDESPSDPRPRKRASTISFKVESATLDMVREASLEIEPLQSDVVVSSCSTSPISELEDSADVVIVNPEAEQVSYSTLTRKRATGLNPVIKKSADSALKRSVKINASLAAELDDEIDGENLSPMPRVSTLNRFRNTFSWTRGRSLARQSFDVKSKDNFLSFHNISYTVQQKKFFQALGTKVILKNVR